MVLPPIQEVLKISIHFTTINYTAINIFLLKHQNHQQTHAPHDHQSEMVSNHRERQILRHHQWLQHQLLCAHLRGQQDALQIIRIIVEAKV
jgi:hypothetical protein